MFRVIQEQHPVGQGGMFTGQLHGAGFSMTWMYDCGSNNRAALKREIKALTFQEIDYLFISHLDADHVGGLEYLFKQSDKQVNSLILPYFPASYLLYQIAHAAIEEEELSGLTAFADDPAAWLSANGFEGRLYRYVPWNSDRREEDEQPTSAAPPEDLTEEGGVWNPSPSPIESEGDQGIKQLKLEPGSGLFLGKSGSGLMWVLHPFVLSVGEAKQQAFLNMLTKMFNVQTIIRLLKQDPSKEKIKRLKAAYKEISNNHNHISMTLYSGFAHESQPALVNYRSWTYAEGGACSWFLTGDQNIKTKNHRHAISNYYTSYLSMISHFMIPHHGSKKDFDPAFLDQLPSVELCYAAAAVKNRYGHPDPDLLREIVSTQSVAVRQVTADPSSAILVKSRFFA